MAYLSSSSPLGTGASEHRSFSIPSPPPLFPSSAAAAGGFAISPLSPLAPLGLLTSQSSYSNGTLLDLSSSVSRSLPLPAPVFLDLSHEVNRSVMTAGPILSADHFPVHAAKSHDPFSASTKAASGDLWGVPTKAPAGKSTADIFGASPVLVEKVIGNDAPTVPEYIERMSAFYSGMGSTAAILSQLSTLLNASDIDHVVKSSKIKSVAYVNDQPVHFRVHVFFDTPSQRYLVEFQKRDGCCFAFRRLYKNLLRQMDAQLCDEELVKDAPAPAASAKPSARQPLSLERLSLKDSAADAPKVSLASGFLDGDSAGLLLNMAQSQCMQAQREAVRALAASSRQDAESACAAVASKSANLSAFTAAVSNTLLNSVQGAGADESGLDHEIARCVLTFLNNCLEQKCSAAATLRKTLLASRQTSAERIVNRVLSLLDEPLHLHDELIMAEIKRQCARCLAVLAASSLAEMKPALDAGAMSIIARYESSQDKRLSAYIVAAKSAIAAR
jgi:hypothetical protein